MDNPRKIKLFGDRDEAMRKYGKGQALLRATKAISELLGIPYYRLFSADKSVIAQSISGMQDQIILSHEPEVPIEEEEENPNCTIILLNVPEVIPPMKWYAPGLETFTKVDNVWIIKDPDGVIEVEGIDYLKTYYRLNITDCESCPLDFSVCESNELASSLICHPFTYNATKLLYMGESVPYFQGWPLRVPPVPPDPKNHLIYSLEGSGQAEILKFGSDNQGTYFLWKAYTEWGTYPPTSITFSRTGLGYLLLKAFIQFEGIELCKAETIIKVDCCQKDISQRRIEQPDRLGYSGLWWESESGPNPQNCGNQPFMFYGTMKMCEVPSEILAMDLFIMACIPVRSVIFYVLPDIFGSCLPFEWELSGPGIWTPGGNYGEIGYYDCPPEGMDCHSEILIRVTDRCGTTTTVNAKSCCEVAGPLSILYTSLLMSCGQEQELTSVHGCGPYSWSLTGGGGSLSEPWGDFDTSVTYTAPATNPNCTSNPTITITDCCGTTAQIKLAVNCYTPTYLAYGIVYYTCWWVWFNPGGCDQGWHICQGFHNYSWSCDGVLRIDCNTALYGPDTCPNYSNKITPCPGSVCGHPIPPATCWTDQCSCVNPYNCPCDTMRDVRTDAMFQQGCCPINPLTGLPF